MLAFILIIAYGLEVHDKAVLFAAINDDFFLPATQQAYIDLEAAEAIMLNQLIQ